MARSFCLIGCCLEITRRAAETWINPLSLHSAQVAVCVKRREPRQGKANVTRPVNENW
jgi:hypothetical protein